MYGVDERLYDVTILFFHGHDLLDHLFAAGVGLIKSHVADVISGCSRIAGAASWFLWVRAADATTTWPILFTSRRLVMSEPGPALLLACGRQHQHGRGGIPRAGLGLLHHFRCTKYSMYVYDHEKRAVTRRACRPFPFNLSRALGGVFLCYCLESPWTRAWTSITLRKGGRGEEGRGSRRRKKRRGRGGVGNTRERGERLHTCRVPHRRHLYPDFLCTSFQEGQKSGI